MKSNRSWGQRFVQFIRQSIRLQLIFTFAVCTAVGVGTGGACQFLLELAAGNQWVTYGPGMDRIDDKGRQIVHTFLKEPDVPSALPTLRRDIEGMSRNLQVDIALVNFSGEAFLQSSHAHWTTFTLRSAIEASMARRQDIHHPGPYISVYPVSVLGKNAFAVVRGIPDPDFQDEDWAHIFSVSTGLAMFMFLFYRLTRRKMHYIQDLARGLVTISTGDLRTRVPIAGGDELASLATHINQMAGKLDLKMEEERRAEREKNELISNVSHDLRTPLTLIMGYLNLLKDGHYETEAQFRDYLDITYGKSEKLKKLIDDLFEFTKITTRGFELNLEPVNLVGLLEQVTEEFVSIAEQEQLQICRQLPEQPIPVLIDPHQMSRVFDNILNNALKYSHKPGRVDISVDIQDKMVTVSVENDADPFTSDDLSRLFERFYRVDSSRSSSTGGSGLGLAIAKGIVAHHGGDIWAETHSGKIAICVKLPIHR